MAGRPSARLRPCNRTVDPTRFQIAAGRDHFGVDGELALARHLAEIRRTPGTHQRLQRLLPAGAHDLYLQVPAAGRAAPVVGRAAGCGGAGIGARAWQDRQRPPRRRGRRQPPRDHPAALHQVEPVAIELSQLRPPAGGRRGRGVTVRAAAGAAAFLTQEPAGDVEHGVHVEIAFTFPQVEEGDVLRVAQEPGGLVVERRVTLVERPI